MEEFSSKLGGFKKFKTETSDDMFDLSQSTRGNQLSTNGVNLKGAGNTPIGELNRGFESNIGGKPASAIALCSTKPYVPASSAKLGIFHTLF